MGSKLNFTDQENFYQQLLALEAKKEDYDVDTGIMDVKKLPLRLLHHIGISKEEIAHKQHKVIEESDFMLDFVEPMLTKLNTMMGRYQEARGYEFSVMADDYDTIKIHASPRKMS
jgi:hypothetical protein